MDRISEKLMLEFKLRDFQVENTVKLIDDGSTIPFIARYRKEMTGGMDDQVLRELNERLIYLRNLDDRKNDVKRLIDDQDKLTQEIEKALDKAVNIQEIEDIYRPYKPKRRTRATIAKEKGLEPLANIIYLQLYSKENIISNAKKFINIEKGVNSEEESINGALDIIAEEISDNADYRRKIRNIYLRDGIVISKAKKKDDSVYRMYYDYKEPVNKIAKHRVLAINRGEKDEYLSIKIYIDESKIVEYLKGIIIKDKNSGSAFYLKEAIEDSFKRLIAPSVEREVRSELTELANEHAIKIFSENLRSLLLQSPVKDNVVLGLDPAYRTGCKLAIVNETGKLLITKVIYPTPPQNKVEESKKIVLDLINKYSVNIISIGNGTATKEAEIFVAELIKEVDREIYYMVVSEAGASVYSASKLGAKEFPDFDVALRSAVSIARRLQDPLAELVKIDPKSIGVGQYQHDMNQKKLDNSLKGVVEYCVNNVGIDLNTASPSLLQYVSGINTSIAANIVEYREIIGKFSKRSELKKVKKLGNKAFEQCAGFLRISESSNILDNTSVHPESYSAAKILLEKVDYTLEDVKKHKIIDIKDRIKKKDKKKLAEEVGIGLMTLNDIINELIKPGRDPRDELPKPILQTDVLDIKDLKENMILTGTVRNVADFGAFVDLGVHQDGLLHISEISNQYIKNPMEVLSIGDIVKVKILNVDIERKRISLTMKNINK
ncbi:MAG: Tex family protein [Clostridiales bacterium]